MKKSWLPMVLRNTDVNQDSGNGSQISNASSDATDSTKTDTTKATDKEPTLAETVRSAYKDSMDKQRAVSDEVKDQQEDKKSSVQKLNDTQKEASKEVLGKDSDKSKQKDLDEASKDKQKQDKDSDSSQIDKEGSDSDKASDSSDKDGSKSDTEKEEAWLDKTLSDRKPVPYDRFKAIYDKRSQLATEIEQVRPLADSHKKIVQYCETNGITPDQFSRGLELLAAINTDPAKAIATLTAFSNDVRTQTGDVLPADLQAEVDSGDLTEQRAKEIAKYRAGERTSKQQQEVNSQRAVQEREQTFLREVAKDSAVWTNTKQSTDPDFRPKQSANEPDGKYEFVRAKYGAMTSEVNAKGEYVYPVRNSTDVVAYLEKAYKEVDRVFNQMSPRSTQKTKNLSSNNSNGSVNEKAPENLADVVRQVGARHGIHT